MGMFGGRGWGSQGMAGGQQWQPPRAQVPNYQQGNTFSGQPGIGGGVTDPAFSGANTWTAGGGATDPYFGVTDPMGARPTWAGNPNLGGGGQYTDPNMGRPGWNTDPNFGGNRQGQATPPGLGPFGGGYQNPGRDDWARPQQQFIPQIMNSMYGG